jgi:hypothetical protein
MNQQRLQQPLITTTNQDQITLTINYNNKPILKIIGSKES